MRLSDFFLVFGPMLSSLIIDSNKKANHWILNEISSETIKPFLMNVEVTFFYLANGRIILKFNNSVLIRKSFIV